jgi:glycosyltransferase involved in cell wall biosynthesis
MLPDWELVLIGAQQNPVYVQRVKEMIGDDARITIKSDLSRQQYARELGEASLVWAATGYQSPEKFEENGPRPPSSAEHWGIFPVEAAALRTPTFCHNSGGTPEGPAIPWDTPEELIAETLNLIGNDGLMEAHRDAAYEAAFKYTMEVQGARLLDIIERPIVVTPHEIKAKIFITRPERSSVTVGMVSDGPEITTGFANLTRMISNGLGDLGYNIKILAYQDPHLGPTYTNDRFKTWRAWPGVSPLELMPRFIQDEQPTILYLNYDPGNIRTMLDVLAENRISLPVVSYFPIESAPVIPQIIDTLRMIQVGWQDKFVVVSVGRNKRTKNFMPLLDAAALLKDEGHNDIRFYIHTNVEENIPNSSMPLDEAAEIRGLQGYVYFPIDLQAQIYGVPYDDPRHINVERSDDIVMQQRQTLAAMTFIERLWLASGDAGAYVTTSQAEGFGLVPVEAMACGVRVLAINDGGPQLEVLGSAPTYLTPTHSEYWHTCGLLPQVNPHQVAQAILDLKGNKYQDDWDITDQIGAGIDQAAKYRWADVVAKFDEAILRRISL